MLVEGGAAHPTKKRLAIGGTDDDKELEKKVMLQKIEELNSEAEAAAYDAALRNLPAGYQAPSLQSLQWVVLLEDSYPEVLGRTNSYVLVLPSYMHAGNTSM